mmetsp:Transcript_8069/g.16199  ORF Transcript_8069/g.16199 Transcript_8069/m.16199 type:complete len:138 (-) Transcript_8069:266-679(-)
MITFLVHILNVALAAIKVSNPNALKMFLQEPTLITRTLPIVKPQGWNLALVAQHVRTHHYAMSLLEEPLSLGKVAISTQLSSLHTLSVETSVLDSSLLKLLDPNLFAETDLQRLSSLLQKTTLLKIKLQSTLAGALP